jgi:hypothetical protein
MTTHPEHPSASLGSDIARARWWASSVVITVLGLVGAVASLLAGVAITGTLCSVAVAFIACTERSRARDEFRRGWRRGYESAVRTALEFQAGRTPDVEVRAAVHGDPIPEPWDVHVPPAKPRSLT